MPHPRNAVTRPGAGGIPASSSTAARAWAVQLDQYATARDYRGYDPFDVKEHPWIRMVQRHPPLRKLTSGLCDLFPNTARKLLRVQAGQNAKTFALIAMARLRLYQALGDPAWLEGARECLDWLCAHAAPGYVGLCWGYPFDVHATGLDTPAGTPIGVVSAIAGEAFELAHSLTGDPRYADALESIGEHFLRDLPQMTQSDASVCFGYAPTDHRRVHNANLHIAVHLLRVYRLTDRALWREMAAPALRFTLMRQRPDGSWPYGEHDPREPFEAGLLALVDHYHTGFVLRSLHSAAAIAPSAEIDGALERGYHYYRTRLCDATGMPLNGYGRFPVDIHACAEAILCPSALSDRFPDGMELADRAVGWAHSHMRDRRYGAVYYRRYPGFASRLVCMRWGVAWMLRALAEYLYRTPPHQ